jgi:hypothetical protein
MTPEQLINKHRKPIDHGGTTAVSEVQLLAEIAYIGLRCAKLMEDLDCKIYLSKMFAAVDKFNRQGD